MVSVLFVIVGCVVSWMGVIVLVVFVFVMVVFVFGELSLYVVRSFAFGAFAGLVACFVFICV